MLPVSSIKPIIIGLGRGEAARFVATSTLVFYKHLFAEDDPLRVFFPGAGGRAVLRWFGWILRSPSFGTVAGRGLAPDGTVGSFH